jgi:hypothetical protein
MPLAAPGKAPVEQSESKGYTEQEVDREDKDSDIRASERPHARVEDSSP